MLKTRKNGGRKKKARQFNAKTNPKIMGKKRNHDSSNKKRKKEKIAERHFILLTKRVPQFGREKEERKRGRKR